MKSGTIGALYALDAIKAAGLRPTARIHFQSVIEEESTGVGALSTLQRGYRADACFIPEPTGGYMVRSQVGVIWFRLRVRGIPVHVAHAGSGANAIMAAYHLIHSLQKLEAAWNERAKADRHFKTLTHPINFNPGIIKGGDWASRAWCDVDCRIATAGLVDRRLPEGDFGLHFGCLARPSLPLQQSARGGMVGFPVGRL
jgi:acetylornithine deacetylase